MIFEHYAKRIGERISPKYVSPSNAPVKERKILGRDIDLFKLMPLFRDNVNDGGFYLKKGIVITRDPEEGWVNLGIYRVQIKGRRRATIQLLPFHNSGLHLLKAMKRGEPLKVAIAIGVDPVLPLVASIPNPPGVDEYAQAGGIKGAPVLITEAETSDLPVPATAEIVIEGRIDPYYREPEGPMGELTGYYSPMKLLPLIEVEAVTFRESPITENLVMGRSIPFGEHEYLNAINTSATLFNQVRQWYPEVKAVNAFYNHGLIAIMQIVPRYPGQAKAAAMALMSTPHGATYLKLVIVVDEDVDPFNWDEIAWALATRLHPSRSVALVSKGPAMPLDPAAIAFGNGYSMDKMIIDLTKPVPPEPPMRGVLVRDRAETAKYFEAIKELLAKSQRG